MSQRNSYTGKNGCPHSYYLKYIKRVNDKKVWRRPAAWLPHGTAFHHAVEVWEKSNREMTRDAAAEEFSVYYRDEVNLLLEETPNTKQWFYSGRYDGQEDIVRRHELGLEQLETYFEYALAHPLEKPDYIEWEFELDLDGVKVVGFIDQVQNGRPRDLKTGANPGDAFQLGVYAEVIREAFELEVNYGDYWMAKKGGPTKPYDLSDWPRDELVREFHELDENIKAGRFEPDPEPSKCDRCSVQSSCVLFKDLF